MTTVKCPSCSAERVDVKGRGNAACGACSASFHSLPLAFAALKRAGVDGAKLQQILGTDGKKLHKCVSCSEMLTTFPVLGETLHACVPCQAVWLAGGAMERFHRVAVGAGKDNAPVSTATMQMAVASISPPISPPSAPPSAPVAAPTTPAPPPSPPPAAASRPPPAPPPAPPPMAPGGSMVGFGTGPSTLMMASAAPGSSEPSAISKPAFAERAIEASLDPPESLDPPVMPEPRLDMNNPPSTAGPPFVPPAKTDGGKAAAAPGSSPAMKVPPTSKPFNLTGGPPPDVASAADAKKDKTGETKKPDKAEKAEKAEKAAEQKKADKKADKLERKDKTGEHKKPDKADKADKKEPPTLYVDEGGSSGLRAAALLVVVLVGAFVAWQYLGTGSLTRVGGGKGARFGQDDVVKESVKVGERLASKVTAERGGGELVVWYLPNAQTARGENALLIELLGDKVHFQTPRNYDGMTVFNGEVRQGDKSGRVRAFFRAEEAWVLVAMSKASGFATSDEGEEFLSSLAEFKK